MLLLVYTLVPAQLGSLFEQDACLKSEKPVRIMRTMKTTRHTIKYVTTLGVVALVHQASAVTVNLGTSADFGILGGSAVTFTAPTTTVVGGDVGVSPGTSITGTGANLSQSGGV